MAGQPYDAIVVGARCAGSPAAMLLARKGYKVLLVDKASFPSDTISTHLIHPPGVAALKRWGLLNRLVATGCPPIHTYAFNFGPFTIAGSPGTDEAPVSYGPRRTVLDKLLVDAAAEAGAEVREGFSVSEIFFEDGHVAGIRGRGGHGGEVTEKARIVIGADGVHSIVAKSVRPEQYNEKPRLNASYYTYWSGLPMNGRFEAYIRPQRAFAAWPTNDGNTLLIAGWPIDEFEANKKDIEGNYMRTLGLAPEFAERVHAAKRVEGFAGATVPNFFRKPYGPGWALVGDAGYDRDSITAQGISDAFRDAELCTNAIDDAFAGRRPLNDAMADYQSTRDTKVMPMYEFTAQLASLQPPPPEVQQVLGAVHGNPDAMEGFAKMNAGVISPAEFFSHENVGRLMAGKQN
ncbi:MAG: NAD(P)/FAD-dependent oxidoreductase [Candidatus Zixiibacteriota bacterium]